MNATVYSQNNKKCFVKYPFAQKYWMYVFIDLYKYDYFMYVLKGTDGFQVKMTDWKN
jgi:hypothetical protein